MVRARWKDVMGRGSGIEVGARWCDSCMTVARASDRISRSRIQIWPADPYPDLACRFQCRHWLGGPMGLDGHMGPRTHCAYSLNAPCHSVLACVDPQCFPRIFDPIARLTLGRAVSQTKKNILQVKTRMIYVSAHESMLDKKRAMHRLAVSQGS